MCPLCHPVGHQCHAQWITGIEKLTPWCQKDWKPVVVLGLGVTQHLSPSPLHTAVLSCAEYEGLPDAPSKIQCQTVLL